MTVLIENYIPAGYQNRVSRRYLHEILHLPDRSIREQIEDALNRGILIVSCDGGYFQRLDESDDPYIKLYLDREDRRFRTQSHNNKMRRRVWNEVHPEVHPNYNDGEIPGQMSLF